MKREDEWAFFRKPSGQLAYHKKCIRCVHKCKQSFRVKWLECPRFTRADCTKTLEKTLDEKNRIKGNWLAEAASGTSSRNGGSKLGFSPKTSHFPDFCTK